MEEEKGKRIRDNAQLSRLLSDTKSRYKSVEVVTCVEIYFVEKKVTTINVKEGLVGIVLIGRGFSSRP